MVTTIEAELVGDRHQDRAAGARLQVLLGDVARLRPSENRLQRLEPRTFDRRSRNPHDVVLHAECVSAISGGIVVGGFRSRCTDRVASRNGTRAAPSASTAIVGDDRGIDAAGQAEHNARKAVLVDVVAEAHDAGAPVGLPPVLGKL